MLSDLRAESDIRGQRIDLRWSWTGPGPRPELRLDTWIDERYRRILERGKPNENHLDSTVALYLYGRSFFLKEPPLAGKPREAVNYYLEQARKYWLDPNLRQSQGHLALACTGLATRPPRQPS